MKLMVDVLLEFEEQLMLYTFGFDLDFPLASAMLYMPIIVQLNVPTISISLFRHLLIVFSLPSAAFH